MSVVFTRTVTPNPGHLGETMEFAKKRLAALKKEFGVDISLNARFGGPAGQLNMVSYHDNMGELEDMRRKVMEAVGAGKIPQAKPGTIQEVEDVIWLKV